MATYLVRKGVGSNPTSVISSFFFFLLGLQQGTMFYAAVGRNNLFQIVAPTVTYLLCIGIEGSGAGGGGHTSYRSRFQFSCRGV